MRTMVMTAKLLGVFVFAVSVSGVSVSQDFQTNTNAIHSADGDDFDKANGFLIEVGSSLIAQLHSAGMEPLNTPGTQNSNSAAFLQSQVIAQMDQDQIATVQKLQNLFPKMIVDKSYHLTFNGFLVKGLSAEEARALQRQGFHVTPNLSMHANLEQSVPLIGAQELWKVKDAAGTLVTGKGMRIGIIDTGINYRHRDLGLCTAFVGCAKVVGGFDFVNFDSDPIDDNGHGSHVAAIAAGNGVLKGVAPDALLYAYKVLDANGSGFYSDVIAAIERSVDPNQDNNIEDHLDVINLSLGGPNSINNPVVIAVDNAVTAGVVAAVAAGNSGPGTQTVEAPGVSALAITVAATSKVDERPSFSSRGPVHFIESGGTGFYSMKPDIAAPGVSICAARGTTGYASYVCKDTKHVAFSGTSMAAPHVAGAVALVKQLHPDWSSAEIKASLMGAAKKVAYSPLDVGSGRLDLRAFSNTLMKKPVTIKIDPISDTPNDGLHLITAHLSGDLSNAIVEVSLAPSSSFYETNGAGNWSLAERVFISGKTWDGNFEVSDASLPDGDTLVKVEVVTGNKERYSAFGYFLVDRLRIATPLWGDIYGTHSPIPIRVKTPNGTSNNIRVKVGKGENPVSWTTLTGAAWNPKDATEGVYSIVARDNTSTDKVREDKVLVYISPKLHKGWPKRITSCLDYPCIDHWGYSTVQPVLDDLDGDGVKEVIVVVPGEPGKLRVYNIDGSLRWERALGKFESWRSSRAVIGRVKNGEKRIYVSSEQYSSKVLGTHKPTIFAFNSKGEVPIGWPVSVPANGGSERSILTADLAQDGSDRVIFSGLEYSFSGVLRVYIFDESGLTEKEFALPYTPPFSFDLSLPVQPAVGNFDDDKDLELVVPTLSGPTFVSDRYALKTKVNVLKRNGKMLTGWPRTMSYRIKTSVVVADLDRDGKEEIVTQDYRKIYVYSRDGSLRTGFPVWAPKLNEFISPLAVGALTPGSNTLDIFSCKDDPAQQCLVIDLQGKVRPGWPNSMIDYVTEQPVVADTNGDGIADVIVPSDGTLFGVTYLKGLDTYSGTGSYLKGSSFVSEYAPMHLSIGDADSDGKMNLLFSSEMDMELVNNRALPKLRHTLYLLDLDAPYNPATVFWPMEFGNVARNGRMRQ